jgi:hypothetical protein
MKPRLLSTVRATEKAVNRLVEQCRKNGPIYDRNPKVVAHVNRTSKWLLNAVAALKRELDEAPGNPVS